MYRLAGRAIGTTWSFRPDELKPWHLLSINFNRLQEHFLRSYPKSSLAVVLPVNDHFFQRFAVLCDTDNNIFFPLEVLVSVT